MAFRRLYTNLSLSQDFVRKVREHPQGESSRHSRTSRYGSASDSLRNPCRPTDFLAEILGSPSPSLYKKSSPPYGELLLFKSGPAIRRRRHRQPKGLAGLCPQSPRAPAAVQHFARRSANPRVWQDFVRKVREHPQGWAIRIACAILVAQRISLRKSSGSPARRFIKKAVRLTANCFYFSRAGLSWFLSKPLSPPALALQVLGPGFKSAIPGKKKIRPPDGNLIFL